ncbi:DMT family transporter [uncultured Ferrimonas sp.]|uniref:DMT family transporter n=1 Tax=uncultured Ferrimonas sp. TaxID=432640 RepID=UPI002625693D|nr:DMT family transporter [uncultured Ferrimonas sp.]
MSGKSFANLLLLSAIWGGSFLLLRLAAGAVGPAMLIGSRLMFAALFLSAIALLMRKPMALQGNVRHYAILGGVNSALPFLLLAYSAQTLSTSMLSIINASAPIFGAVVGAIWMRQWLDLKTTLGLLLGSAGVVILVGFDGLVLDSNGIFAVLSCLGAALCYGIASNYARHAKPVNSFANAHGSMWASALMLLPLALLFPARNPLTVELWLLMAILGVVCSGIAYLLYFKLIEDEGATSALTVTYLVPVFGVMWGHGLLDEPIGWSTLLGCAVVLSGTAMVTGLKIRPMMARLRG